jgi:predicted DNA-binding transcriptional regulator AlpA
LKGVPVTIQVDSPSQFRTVDELPELLTRRELAAFTGLTLGTLARWAMENVGPHVTKLGGAVRYRKADVIAWLDGAR